MPDVKIEFLINDEVIGEMGTSLESFDASPHIISKDIIDRIRDSNNYVKICFTISK